MKNPVARKEVSYWVDEEDMEKVKGRGICADSILLQHYRSWVVWRCPTVRFLDYKKVKDAEREKAKELFGTVEEPSSLASQVQSFSPVNFTLKLIIL